MEDAVDATPFLSLLNHALNYSLGAFVSDGIESALAQARADAGDKDVGIWGGANAVQQYLAAGLIETPAATHRNFNVSRAN
jgi:dihydrofolate reductase